MSPIPSISDAEWAVLQVLWKQPWLTATQVYEKLPNRSWKLTTVRTFLNRLEKKGALTAKEGDGAKVFASRVTREAYVNEVSQSFLERVFEGAASSLLVHFAQSKPLTKAEIAELKGILARKEGGK